MIITNEYLDKYKTYKGGWTRSQFEALGLTVNNGTSPSKGWKKRVIGTEISEENAKIFEAKFSAKDLRDAPVKHKELIEKKKTKEAARRQKRLEANREKIKAYKAKFGITEELTQTQCAAILSRKSGRKVTKKTKRKQRKEETFYESREWRELRYEALKKYGRQCLCCGGKPPEVQLHVDHIKPRSKYPELELDINNLQIMCKDCNLGKSNKDEIDYRFL